MQGALAEICPAPVIPEDEMISGVLLQLGRSLSRAWGNRKRCQNVDFSSSAEIPAYPMAVLTRLGWSVSQLFPACQGKTHQTYLISSYSAAIRTEYCQARHTPLAIIERTCKGRRPTSQKPCISRVDKEAKRKVSQQSSHHRDPGPMRVLPPPLITKSLQKDSAQMILVDAPSQLWALTSMACSRVDQSRPPKPLALSPTERRKCSWYKLLIHKAVMNSKSRPNRRPD